MEGGRPTMVAMKGHPGTGKSTLAAALVSALKWPLVDKDDARDALTLLRHADIGTLNTLSYQIMFKVAESQLRHGLSLVLDCPLARPHLFFAARDLARRYGALLAVVECSPVNQLEWKHRLEDRFRSVAEADSSGSNLFPERFRSVAEAGSSGSSLVPGTFSDALFPNFSWHKPRSWEELQQIILGYDRCFEYDMGDVNKIVVDTTALSKEQAADLVLRWLCSLGKQRASLD